MCRYIEPRSESSSRITATLSRKYSTNSAPVSLSEYAASPLRELLTVDALPAVIVKSELVANGGSV